MQHRHVEVDVARERKTLTKRFARLGRLTELIQQVCAGSAEEVVRAVISDSNGERHRVRELALALHRAGIRSTVFEAYDSAADGVGGGISLDQNDDGSVDCDEVNLGDEVVLNEFEVSFDEPDSSNCLVPSAEGRE